MEEVNDTPEKRIEDDSFFRTRVNISGIPVITIRTHRLYTFLPAKGSQAAYDEVLYYVAHDTPRHPMFSLFGPTGTGKTHLAVGIGWHLLENTKMVVRYFQAQDMLDNLRAGFRRGGIEKENDFDEVLNGIKNCGLLILDDLGAEQETDWASSTLDSIVDYRYFRQMRTVFTSNLSADQLPDRIKSRISEGIVCTLKCKDFRELKGRAHGEAMAGA